jgi:uncharacterized protein (TIGR03437 family)
VRKLITVLFICTAALEAQPVVQGVANGLPGPVVLAPGSIANVYGSNLIVGTTPTTVMLGTKAAFVITAASIASQLRVQLPVDAPLGPAMLTVTAGGQTSAPALVTIGPYSPAMGVFVDAGGNLITPMNPATPGETLVVSAIGLGPTNPQAPTGSPTTGQTVEKAMLTVGGEMASVLFAGGVTNASAAPGAYQVTFVVPMDASACDTAVVLTIGGAASFPDNIPLIAAPTPALCAVENSATGLVRVTAHGMASNSFITVYAAATVTADSAPNIFPATSYQGVQVLVNGTPVPLYAVASLTLGRILINAMAPSELAASGTALVSVKTAAGSSAPLTVALASTDPGVFRLPGPNGPNGQQGAVLVAGTYAFAMSASFAAFYGLPSCAGLPVTTPCGQPATAGDNIVIYMTGGGLATPNADPNGKPVPTGSVAPIDGSVVYQTVVKPTIMIGGLPAVVGFSGIAPGTGSEYQINTTIPVGVQTSATVPVAITMGGNTDTVTIAVNARVAIPFTEPASHP